MQVLIIIYEENCITNPYQWNGDAPAITKKLKFNWKVSSDLGHSFQTPISWSRIVWNPSKIDKIRSKSILETCSECPNIS